jgi:tetratricopeptide (TPR) repeat protein
VYSNHMDYEPARMYLERAVAESRDTKNRNDGELATIYGNLAQISLYAGDFEAADVAYAQAAGIIQRTYGESSSQGWLAAAMRARAAHLGGNRLRAGALFDALLRTVPQASTEHDAIQVHEWYAGCLTAEGRVRQALPMLEAVEHAYQSTRQYDFELPRVRATLGDAYARVGRVEDARRMLKAAFDQRVGGDPADFQPLLAVRERWARFLVTQGNTIEAEEQFREVIRQAHGRNLAHVALAYGGLARIALARADGRGSVAASGEAVRLFDHVTGFRDVRMGPYLWLIHSQALLATGDRAGAREWATRALEASRRFDDPSAESIAEAEAAVRAAVPRSG